VGGPQRAYTQGCSRRIVLGPVDVKAFTEYRLADAVRP
jgi:hypothetical protein